MARRRFFVDEIRRGEAQLTGDDAAHLTRVLRVEPGQRFEIADNSAAYLAEVVEARKAQVTFRILEQLPEPPAEPAIILAASLVKFDRFEWIIEKATELGAAVIVPVESERTERGLAAAAVKRNQRWQRIARESSQQSRRIRMPIIQPPQDLASAAAAAYTHRYVLDEEAEAPLLASLPSREIRSSADAIGLLLGPEGGWTDRERSIIRAQAWVPVSLGHRILRAETAAVAAISIVSNAWFAALWKPM